MANSVPNCFADAGGSIARTGRWAITEGYHAGLATLPLRINAECPHADGTDAATTWWRGWLKGEHEVMAASPAALVIAGEVGFPVLFMPDWPESRKAVVQEWIANCSDAALLAHLEATRRSMEILDGDLEDGTSRMMPSQAKT